MAAICLVFLIIINIVKTEHFDIHKLRKYSHKQFPPETTKYFGYVIIYFPDINNVAIK